MTKLLIAILELVFAVIGLVCALVILFCGLLWLGVLLAIGGIIVLGVKVLYVVLFA